MNKTAIVTGACRGIGLEIARRLAQQGAFVALCDIQFDRAEGEAETLRNGGAAAQAFHLDVSAAADWHAVRDAVLGRSGQMDILVNNAGINDRGSIIDTPVAVWERTLAVNLTGAFLGMQTMAPAMQPGASIVNVCSLASHVGGLQAAYGASKWALRGLTKTAAMEFVDRGIRVNSVSPSVIETELNEGQPYRETFSRLTPMHRNGTMQDIANAALFLASDESAFITGEDLLVDGGFAVGAAMRCTMAMPSQAIR